MAHPWLNNVVGGISKPRFLKVGENLFTNPRFNNGSYSQWTYHGSWLTGGRTIVDDDAFNEYMGRLNVSQDDNAYVVGDINTNLLTGTKVLITFRIKSAILDSHEIDVILQMASSKGAYGIAVDSKVITINEKIKRVSLVGDIGDTPGSYVGVRIHLGEGVSSNSDLRFDDLYICEIYEDYTMKEPNVNFLEFSREVQGSNELWDGKIQEHDVAWRPNFHCDFQFMNKEFESIRQRIIEMNTIFVIPHIDFGWGFFGTMMDSYRREYPWDRYLGHKGVISIRGKELLKSTVHPISLYTTSQPIIIEDATITISSSPSYGVSVDYAYEDLSGSDTTIFTLTEEAGTKVTLTAPATHSGMAFSHWESLQGNSLGTNRTIEVTFQDGEAYRCVYIPASPTEGYGYEYGNPYN